MADRRLPQKSRLTKRPDAYRRAVRRNGGRTVTIRAPREAPAPTPMFRPGITLDPSRVRDFRGEMKPHDPIDDLRRGIDFLRTILFPRDLEDGLKRLGRMKGRQSPKISRRTSKTQTPQRATPRVVEGMDGQAKTQIYRGNRLMLSPRRGSGGSRTK